MVPVMIINSEIGLSESTGLHVIKNRESEVKIGSQRWKLGSTGVVVDDDQGAISDMLP